MGLKLLAGTTGSNIQWFAPSSLLHGLGLGLNLLQPKLLSSDSCPEDEDDELSSNGESVVIMLSHGLHSFLDFFWSRC